MEEEADLHKADLTCSGKELRGQPVDIAERGRGKTLSSCVESTSF